MDNFIINNPNILFSIITPSYNRSSYVLRVVDSFLKQTYTNFELIIVDDGSTDDTKVVIEGINDSRIKYFWKENGERGSARNFGAKQAKGDYLNYFDSDDIAYPNHLQTAVDGILSLGYPMIIHLGYEMRNEKRELIYKHKSKKNNGNDRIIKINYINPNPLFIHRNTLHTVTYNCDREISGTEDWLYHLQLIARYQLLSYDKTITSCMIVHADRSMNKFCGDEVLHRNRLLLKYLKEDTVFTNKYFKKINVISAEMQTLAALHFVIEGKRIRALKVFYNSFLIRPAILFKRRTLGILKHLIYAVRLKK